MDTNTLIENYVQAASTIQNIRVEIAQKERLATDKTAEVLSGMKKFFAEALKDHSFASHTLGSMLWGIYYDGVSVSTKEIDTLDVAIAECYHMLIMSPNITSIYVAIQNPSGQSNKQIKQLCTELNTLEGFKIEATYTSEDPSTKIIFTRKE